MATILETAPASEPVTKDDAKTHIRVDLANDDSYIEALIAVARRIIEDITNRKFITQTWKYILDEYPDDDTIILPFVPVSAVSHIKTTDQEKAVETFDSDSYYVDIYSEPARIVLKDGESWPDPSAGLREANAVEIQFTVGYANAAAVPGPLLQALKMLVGHFYENREATMMSGRMKMEDLPMGVQSLIGSYRLFSGEM